MKNKLDAQFKAALTFQQRGELEEAKSICEKILKEDPTYAEAMAMLGMLALQCEQTEVAIQWLLQAIKVDNKNPTYYFYLGSAYKHQKEFDEAIIQFKKAISINPHFAEAYNNIATIYHVQQREEEALQHYAKAVNLKPDYLDAHRNLGSLLLHMRNLDAAEKQFKNVLTLKPGSIYAQYHLGNIYFQQERNEESRDAFLAVIEVDPENIEALNNLGAVFLQLDEPQKSLHYFTQALALDDTRNDIRSNIAATFMQHNRFENALRHYREMIRQHADDREMHYNMAVALMSLGNNAEAMTHYDIVLEKDPKHIPSLTNKGAIFWRENKLEKAIICFEKIIDLESDNASVKYMLDTIKGNKVVTVPTQYVQDLFDYYAPQYDKHMRDTLHYQLPEQILEALKVCHIKTDAQWELLDLGCGSGLAAEVIQSFTKSMTGVDVSEKMIELAKEKNIYDECVVAEINEYLEHCEKSFDAILAADVFAYLGNLKKTFELCAKRLVEKGYFIFSVENTENDPFLAQKSGRFAYHEKYIHGLLDENNFKILHQSRVNARVDERHEVEIMIYVVQLSKPAE